MASKKKASEKVSNEAAENIEAVGQMITVDAKKLSLGLKKTFEGVAMVFDSIGCGEASGITGAVSDYAGAVKEASNNGAEVEEAAEAAEAPKAPKAAEAAEAVEEAKADTVAEEPKEEPKEKPKAEEPKSETVASTVSTVSIDDITKIIVQKIKQNRSNNEKIGAILKSYGLAKVGDLVPTQYEAFLTDLAAI